MHYSRYVLNRNDSKFESFSDSGNELENTDFDNTEPQPINDINLEIEIANWFIDSDSTESNGDTPKHPLCNKKPKLYKWVPK